jgi:large subunit ribosomal protein L3
MAGLIGKKVGMTRIFDDEGVQVPVTVIEAGPCPVVSVRSEEQDGYQAIQVGFGAKKAKRTPGGEMGHAAKAGLEAAPRLMREFRTENGEEYEVGQEMGGDRSTIRNMQIVRVDGDRNLLFVKGGIPGARNSYVLISK